MRNGEKIARERQVLINQISIMAGIKILLEYSSSADAQMRISTLDASISSTSEILRGVRDASFREIV